MVGGTASVRGEDSRYQQDISRQLDETLDNMASILAASRVSGPGATPTSLHAYSDIRVYYKHAFDRIRDRIRGAPEFSLRRRGGVDPCPHLSR